MTSFLARAALRGAGVALTANHASVLHPEAPVAGRVIDASPAADGDVALESKVPEAAPQRGTNPEPRTVSTPTPMEPLEPRRVAPRREKVVPARNQDGAEPRVARNADVTPQRALEATLVRDETLPVAGVPVPVIIPAPARTLDPMSRPSATPMATDVEAVALVPSRAPVEESPLLPRTSLLSPPTPDLTTSDRPASRQQPAVEPRPRPDRPIQQPVAQREREATPSPERVPVHPAPDARSIATRVPVPATSRIAAPPAPVRVHIGAIEIHAPAPPSAPAASLAAAPVVDHVLPASFDDFAALRRYAAWSR